MLAIVRRAFVVYDEPLLEPCYTVCMKRAVSWRSPVAIVILGLAGAGLIWIFLNVILDQFRPAPPLALGATFSTKYARELGLDAPAAFTATLRELGVRRIRLPIYWDEVEPAVGEFHFDEVDALLAEATKYGAEIIPVIGLRVPRWPECHAPAWAKILSTEEQHEQLLAYLRTVVTRYSNNDAIIAWQVENEPLLAGFGECPEPDREFLKQEVALVRELDARPIIITESGELSSWLGTVGISDILGISMYRVVWNRFVGYLYYPLSPGFYRYRAETVRPFTGEVIVTELQVEPWVARGIFATSLDEQYVSMNPARLQDNLSFVSRAGFREVYLWGIEWWYWLKEKQGKPELWELGKEVFAKSALFEPLRSKLQ